MKHRKRQDMRMSDPLTRSGKATKGSSFAMEVLTRLGDPAMSVGQIANLIGSNPSISKKLLRIANSPLLGLPQRVESVDAAIMLLGFETLRRTMTSQLVSSAVRNVVNTVVTHEGFWNHSLGCALAARLLARKFAPSQLGEAFLAGLLHDVGHLMGPRQVPLLSLSGSAGEVSPITADHEEIGARLAAHWNLGADVEEAIRFHHRPSSARKNPVLTATVHLADALADQVEACRSTIEPELRLDRSAMAILWADESDLSPAALEGVLRGRRGRGKLQDVVTEIRESLLEGIGSLDEPERLTLALRYQEGLSFEEIGRILQRGVPEVQRDHASALAKLGTILTQRM